MGLVPSQTAISSSSVYGLTLPARRSCFGSSGGTAAQNGALEDSSYACGRSNGCVARRALGLLGVGWLFLVKRQNPHLRFLHSCVGVHMSLTLGSLLSWYMAN